MLIRIADSIGNLAEKPRISRSAQFCCCARSLLPGWVLLRRRGSIRRISGPEAL